MPPGFLPGYFFSRCAKRFIIQNGYNHPMFLPTTQAEMDRLGWDALDVILVTGDLYIDSPFIGAAVIGKVLLNAGYRVGVIAQPESKTDEDIGRLGEPHLFWGVTAGCIDSMVANYTAQKKPRRSDDYTPGGENNRRPDRATIVYANIIRRYSKRLHPGESARPIVLGGIEASLRRVAHYDFWSDRSAARFSSTPKLITSCTVWPKRRHSNLPLLSGWQTTGRTARSVLHFQGEPPSYIELPSYETVAADKNAFIDMFHQFYKNNDPVNANGLCQKHGDRYLVQNPPALYQTQAELDAVYRLDFERAQHPYYEAQGPVKALETIRFSISTHRGCYGECNFCAIAVHEGRTVRWRSPESILAEAGVLTSHPEFKGYIQDLGGPTANMYGFECDKKLKRALARPNAACFPISAPCWR